MKRTFSIMGPLLVLLGLAALSLAGCSDDFGTPCEFPPSPEIQQFCGGSAGDEGNSTTSTCVDPINPDCESRLCVTFQGSTAFCSQRCASDSGCPAASGCETGTGMAQGVCVPDRFNQ